MENMEAITNYLEKANQIARCADWQELIRQTCDLLMEICAAEAALFYQPGRNAWQGKLKDAAGEEWETARSALLQPGLFDNESAQFFDQGAPALAALPLPAAIRNLLVLPISEPGNAPAGFLLVNTGRPHPMIAAAIARRMASDIEKTAQIAASQQREARLRELNDILGQLGASLDPDQVLRMLIEQARHFLQVEAVSLFLIDEPNNELVLQMASQSDTQINVEQIRVPVGKGIIGYVIQTGETVLVEDAHNDQRHYYQVDQSSGFNTRSILAVPLSTRSINLGQERGTSQERIIGGLEAINKIDGPFQAEDPELLQILAKGAATVLVVAQLYKDANKLFIDVIQAIIAAIDAKDPYTSGHSQRVSEYSVQIAREMSLDIEKIYQVRLGSLFHDVGKIGISDQILQKNGSLTKDEYQIMKRHPTIGENIMSEVHLMSAEIPAMVGHHEHLDGSGYPHGLRGDQISLISRIVAVADVFDAMTSNRPYRAGLPVDEVFAYLQNNTGTHFDENCVAALIRSYRKGAIRTQIEKRHPGR